MNFLSLFAGIGGFDLALSRCGMTSVGAAEIDRNCNSVRRRHYETALGH
jgi:site-specific DNA-cytosine methylase